ncbi:MAG: hypothetical protein ACLR23_18000 [Clostridia bacterium]
MQPIFQDPHSSLNPRMTVGQIIGEGVLAHGMFTRRDPGFSEYIVAIMEQCGLFPLYVSPVSPSVFRRSAAADRWYRPISAVKPRSSLCAMRSGIGTGCINSIADSKSSFMDLKQEQKLTYLFISHDLRRC